MKQKAIAKFGATAAALFLLKDYFYRMVVIFHDIKG
jgi:hypothetical protein